MPAPVQINRIPGSVGGAGASDAPRASSFLQPTLLLATPASPRCGPAPRAASRESDAGSGRSTSPVELQHFLGLLQRPRFGLGFPVEPSVIVMLLIPLPPAPAPAPQTAIR